MKTITLNEKSYNKLKKRLVSEISYGTVDRAYDRSETLFGDVRNCFQDFYTALSSALIQDRWDGRREQNPYIVKIKELADQIYAILNKKSNQQSKFFDATTDGVDHNKFYDSDDAENNDIDDMDLRYLQNNYPK
jgi:hypothetical protein